MKGELGDSSPLLNTSPFQFYNCVFTVSVWHNSPVLPSTTSWIFHSGPVEGCDYMFLDEEVRCSCFVIFISSVDFQHFLWGVSVVWTEAESFSKGKAGLISHRSFPIHFLALVPPIQPSLTHIVTSTVPTEVKFNTQFLITINHQAYRTGWEEEVVSSVCESTAGQFINLFDHLDMKIPWQSWAAGALPKPATPTATSVVVVAGLGETHRGQGRAESQLSQCQHKMPRQIHFQLKVEKLEGKPI